MRQALFPVVLLLALLPWGTPWGMGLAVAASAQQNQEELARVRSRIEAMRQSIERDRGQQDALERDLETAEKQIGEAANKLAAVEVNLAGQQKQLEAAQQKMRDLRQQIQSQKGNLGKQLRAAYAIGRQGEARLLLSQEDPKRVGRLMSYYNYLVERRNGQFKTLIGGLAEVKQAAEQAGQAMNALSSQKAEQQQTLALIQGAKQARSGLLVKLKERLSDEVGQLAQLEANEKELQDLITSLQSVLADSPVQPTGAGFAAMKGQLGWPIRGALLAKYGEAKVGGKLSWKGHWIAAPDNAPVAAVAPGRLVYQGPMHRFGLIAILEHDNGYFTLYGHLRAVSRQLGESLEIGQTLGTAGDTGGYEQSGVYFEIRQGTDALNPQDWLMP
jgi:septal ring factor EnvC (AmiA/AmiB activator)